MIKSITTSLLLYAASLGSIMAQDEQPLSAKLNFLNGDTFSGQIIKWDTEKIQIKSAFLVDPATFPTANLVDVILESDGTPIIQKDDPNAKEKAITTIKMNNRFNMSDEHDVIKGEFKQIDDDSVTIDTAYAGQLKIDRM